MTDSATIDSSAPPPPKRKIAIFGGGPAALAAAFELTTPVGWSSDYEVTVYQIGWRLGGKCATGRGKDARIEEHGLHVLMGWYNNSFWMIKEAYAARKAAGLAPRSPFQDWTDGFVRDNATSLIEYYRDRDAMYQWSVFFPENRAVPGEMPCPTWDVLANSVGVVFSMVLGSPFGTLRGLIHSLFCGPDWWQKTPNDPGSAASRRTPLWPVDTLVVSTAARVAELVGAARAPDSAPPVPPAERVGDLESLMAQIRDGGSCGERAVEALLGVLRGVLKGLAAVAITFNCQDTRRALTILELGVVALIGILEDVWDPGTRTFMYSRIEHLDFREWLRRHGASQDAVEAGIVRFIYAGAFSNLVGQRVGGLFAAGTALRAGIAILAYKGSLVWEMRGGTADTVIAPIYQVLAHRGVKFEFFHEVQSVHYSETGKIERVTVGQQVRLREGVSTYQPLIQVPVQGGVLDCWPNRPLYDQIDPEQARRLQDPYVDLESPWADWTPTPTLLERGKDFDDIILTIPVAALRDVCSELCAHDPRWAGMVEHIQTTPTIAMQIWLSPTLHELGLDLRRWGLPRSESAPNCEVLVDPHSAWGDMTFVLPYERWPEGNRPRTVAYFCGACEDFAPAAPYSDHTYHERQLELSRVISRQWLSDNTSFFWPRATTAETPRGLDLRLLVDPAGPGGTGAEKLRAQYFRANVAPSERYTLAVPFYHQFRMMPGRTGFSNLYVAGDWVWHEGVNAGFFEGATTAGREAAQTLLRSGMLRNGHDLVRQLPKLFVEPDVERPPK